MLLPIPRNDPKFVALSHRFQLERAHQMARARYGGSNDPVIRPKRFGLKWQQLRLSLARLVDWFRAAAKHGFLGSARANWRGYSSKVRDNMKSRLRDLMERTEKTCAAIRLERHLAGLDSEYRPEDAHPPP
jgi:hypothetical protein